MDFQCSHNNTSESVHCTWIYGEERICKTPGILQNPIKRKPSKSHKSLPNKYTKIPTTKEGQNLNLSTNAGMVSNSVLFVSIHSVCAYKHICIYRRMYCMHYLLLTNYQNLCIFYEIFCAKSTEFVKLCAFQLFR